ncbi:S49 family peptidase [Rhodobacteraceae bacterium M382]|nr:S49 family peptidase [Rhodobacteraceae bacterium M382]
MHHARIAQRAFNTPLMVEPSKALAFLSGLGPRIAGQEIIFQGSDLAETDVVRAGLPAQTSLIGGNLTERDGDQGNHPFLLIDGIAVIEIAGTLVHRGAWIGQSSGLTSNEGITAQIEAAVADPAVLGIALEIDSFGGEVAGAFDLADRIRAAREIKPVRAFVVEHALSAGYVLAAQADHITLPRTGAVGSIGVVSLHTEMSGMLEQKGITVTLVHAGTHKTDANPYEPLPKPVQARMQSELEGLRTLFAQTVAAGRGNRLDVHAALDTEAAVLHGAEAVAAGLADAVADPRSAFQAFAESLNHPDTIPVPPLPSRTLTPQSRKETSMNPTTEPADETETEVSASQPETSQAKTETALPFTTAPPSSAQPKSPEPVALPAAPAAAIPAPTPVISADAIRAEAAEVAQVCAQAARLGVQIDASDAVNRGLKPDALRAQVLEDLAARGDATSIVATAPAAAAAKDSPLVAAARKAATDAAR